MKITTPPEKCHPLFPINPSQKVECLSIATLFEHLVGGSTPLPPLQKGWDGGSDYAYQISI